MDDMLSTRRNFLTFYFLIITYIFDLQSPRIIYEAQLRYLHKNGSVHFRIIRFYTYRICIHNPYPTPPKSTDRQTTVVKGMEYGPSSSITAGAIFPESFYFNFNYIVKYLYLVMNFGPFFKSNCIVMGFSSSFEIYLNISVILEYEC
ncbi:hypothetical protein L6452_10840 [Arctium lappa]|uniref:Uncharacterized protein n=1 Tax=Arctium lappa TaxID=4217 RepID=A0ACB9DN88_ARCLA|nr:hypothetical protein L6452_10840 [Arctium lappa]